MIDLTNRSTITQLLHTSNMRPNKKLGQHFLLSKNVIRSIILAASLTSSDTVLEIGPGLGVLTIELAKKAKKIIAVEKDKEMVELLQKNIETEQLKNVQIVNQDALKFSPDNLEPINRGSRHMSQDPDPNGRRGYNLIANLPYQITSPVLWKFLQEEKHKPKQLVIMIQKEVAQRIIARPGQMTLLSVLVQFYAQPKLITHVAKTKFYPPPNVESSVIKLTVHAAPAHINEKDFFMVVKAGFSSKRKMLKNNLKDKLSFSENLLADALAKAELSEKSRAQELSIDNWINLYKMLYNINN